MRIFRENSTELPATLYRLNIAGITRVLPAFAGPQTCLLLPIVGEDEDDVGLGVLRRGWGRTPGTGTTRRRRTIATGSWWVFP
jgi:hypothetical protein